MRSARRPVTYRPTVRSLTTVVTTAALFAVAGAGCSADREAGAELPIRLERVTSVEQYVGPARQRLLSPEEASLLLLAYDTLLAECVEKQGQVLSITDGQRPQWLQKLVTPMYAAQPLGPVNPRRVAQYGFHDPEAFIGAASIEFTGRRTPHAVLAYCEAPTTEALGGRPPEGLSEMVFEAARAASTDPRLAEAQDSWSACMAEQGYDYDLPTQPQREFTTTSEITDSEIEVATASVDCQARTRNIDTYVALVVAHEQRLIDDNVELFADFGDWKDRALAAAARVTAEHAAPANRSVSPAPSLGIPRAG